MSAPARDAFVNKPMLLMIFIVAQGDEMMSHVVMRRVMRRMMHDDMWHSFNCFFLKLKLKLQMTNELPKSKHTINYTTAQEYIIADII